ncbi:MAG: sensor histidine kinase, partial [Brevundimonas sp.]|nr:sensor histidine kinase [Brevundimonas sp.]
MTDTPAPVGDQGPAPQDSSSWWSRFVDGRARAVFGVVYGVAVLIAAAAIWVVAVAPGAGADGGARAVAGQAVLYILLGNLV